MLNTSMLFWMFAAIVRFQDSLPRKAESVPEAPSAVFKSDTNDSNAAWSDCDENGSQSKSYPANPYVFRRETRLLMNVVLYVVMAARQVASVAPEAPPITNIIFTLLALPRETSCGSSGSKEPLG